MRPFLPGSPGEHAQNRHWATGKQTVYLSGKAYFNLQGQVTWHGPTKTVLMLWDRDSGRCEYGGEDTGHKSCREVLWSPVKRSEECTGHRIWAEPGSTKTLPSESIMDMLPCLSMSIKQVVTDNMDPDLLSKVVPWSTKAHKYDWVKRTPAEPVWLSG